MRAYLEPHAKDFHCSLSENACLHVTCAFRTREAYEHICGQRTVSFSVGVLRMYSMSNPQLWEALGRHRPRELALRRLGPYVLA